LNIPFSIWFAPPFRPRKKKKTVLGDVGRYVVKKVTPVTGFPHKQMLLFARARKRRRLNTPLNCFP
jgi:hypothetical protein